jgi:DNA mismatch repair ATPase MutS
MDLTLFSYIMTDKNVAGNQIDQESHFQAEARRIFEYGDKVDKLAAKNLFCLSMLDEVLAGTSQEEGADLNKKVLKALSNYSNCININATHLKSVTELEKETNGKYVNYQVAVEENSNGFPVIENGKIKRLYTIKPGISHQHIAKYVFTEKGVNSEFFNKNIKG